jgi:ubiquinone biosynthesis accessory factor UbiJ
MLLESPFARALSHLLEAAPWARERLAPFAGRTLEVRAPLAPALRFTVAAGGLLELAAEGAAPALVVALGPQALPAAVRGADHLMRAIEVTGDTRLAAEVMFLARHLRWDAEEDLSRLVGDAAAHRLASGARALAAWHADAARRIGESLVEYALEERRILAPRAELEALGAALARLRDGIERLEKRVERLEGRR